MAKIISLKLANTKTSNLEGDFILDTSEVFFNPSLTLPKLAIYFFYKIGLAGEDNEKIVHSRNHTISQTHTHNQPYTHIGQALTSSFV